MKRLTEAQIETMHSTLLSLQVTLIEAHLKYMGCEIRLDSWWIWIPQQGELRATGHIRKRQTGQTGCHTLARLYLLFNIP